MGGLYARQIGERGAATGASALSNLLLFLVGLLGIPRALRGRRLSAALLAGLTIAGLCCQMTGRPGVGLVLLSVAVAWSLRDLWADPGFDGTALNDLQKTMYRVHDNRRGDWRDADDGRARTPQGWRPNRRDAPRHPAHAQLAGFVIAPCTAADRQYRCPGS